MDGRGTGEFPMYHFGRMPPDRCCKIGNSLPCHHCWKQNDYFFVKCTRLQGHVAIHRSFGERNYLSEKQIMQWALSLETMPSTKRTVSEKCLDRAITWVSRSYGFRQTIRAIVMKRDTLEIIIIFLRWPVMWAILSRIERCDSFFTPHSSSYRCVIITSPLCHRSIDHAAATSLSRHHHLSLHCTGRRVDASNKIFTSCLANE